MPPVHRDNFHVANDRAYAQIAAQEAAWWDKTDHPFDTDFDHPTLQAYENERFTGDPHKSWIEVVADYGPFGAGCSIGAMGPQQTARLLETNPGMSLAVFDISGDSLDNLQRDVGKRFPGRLTVHREDMNFSVLPAHSYDLIVSNSCFHHLSNLEHAAFQVNDALTEGGYFFLLDYVAESRFQFSESKKRTFEDAFRDAQAILLKLRSWRIEWPTLEPWNYSPFEAVRSSETLGILRQSLNEVTIQQCLAVAFLVAFVQESYLEPTESTHPAASQLRRAATRFVSVFRRRGRSARRRRAVTAKLNEAAETWTRLLDKLLELDRQYTESGSLLPAHAFGIYRRK